MLKSDMKEFASILKSVMEVYDKGLTADALDIWFAAMETVSLVEFRIAMTKHVKTNQFSPKPADILKLFQKDDGRPGVEKAWGMIPKDESSSCLWTEEMAKAFGAASPLMNEGDMIGARMAFKETYEKSCIVSRDEGKPVKWSVSFGHDPRGREDAVMAGVHNNLISVDRAVELLPSSDAVMNLKNSEAPMLENQNKIKQLISGVKIEKEPEEMIEYDESQLISQVKQPISTNLIEQRGKE